MGASMAGPPNHLFWGKYDLNMTSPPAALSPINAAIAKGVDPADGLAGKSKGYHIKKYRLKYHLAEQ